ncbi:MAG: tetratricopeptide repeat-containing sensor histidine kinase [Cyclobacteriaceae bacterium]|nr:tetratricopeptide repeat-containing sensor histidine kinase [Cyclobacteriaceae bacterium]
MATTYFLTRVAILNLVSVFFKMSKVAAILAIAFIAGTSVCAAPIKIDSLERILATHPVDSVSIDIYCQLSQKYLPSKPDTARKYADMALHLSQSKGYRHGEIVALNCIAEYEYRQGNYASAVEHSMRSLKFSEQSHDSVGMAMSNRALGLIYTFGFKQYDVALQYQLNALKIFERKKDKRNMASFYGNITWIYAGLNQNLTEAHRLALLGLELSKSLNDPQLVSYNYNSQGLIFLQEGQYDSALQNLQRSIQAGIEADDKAVVAYDKSIIGQVYLKQHRYKEAISKFNEAIDESRPLHILEILKDSYDGLAKGYEGISNYPLAYHNHMSYMHLRDSLLNWETTQKAMLTRLEFEGQNKIEELEFANEQEKKEQLIYEVLFGIVLAFFIAVVLLAARNNRQRKETNRLLQEKNQEIAEQNLKLKEANDIKDKFFSIISHDLRSPLSSLKGLLSLLAGNEINDQEFKSFAPKINQRLTGVSETLENLLHWSQSQMKGMSYNPTTIPVRVVTEKCLLLFLETAAEKKLTFSNDIPKDASVYADKNQTELIFRNLIHNAIKFTVNGGSISITSEITDDHVEIRVSDTGIGMSKEQVENLFDNVTARTTHGTDGEKGTGLGLLLCKEMAENNGGRLLVTSEAGKGSTFHVFLRKA